MFIKKMAAAACAATLLMSAASAASAETLRVGSETVYPPFEFLDSSTGQYDGFDMDLIKAIAKKAGFDIHIYSMGLDGLVPALVSGSIDLAVSALTITPERAAKVDFSDPYYESGLSIMTHRDNAAKIKSVKALEGKTLCVEIGSSGALYSQKLKGTKIRTFNSAAEAFLEINQKGCYAMINDKPVNEYFLSQKQAKNMKLKEVPIVLQAENYGFAIQKGNTALAKRINDALKAVKADGTYDKIYKKWFAAK